MPLAQSSRGTTITTQKFQLIDQQSEVFFADTKNYRTLIAASGEQGGKTILGTGWIHRQIDKWKGKPANFVVGAPTYKIMEQSTRPTFMKLATKLLGSWDGKDDAFRLKSGGSVYFRSATDPDSVVGIPDCAAGWIDEAGKCSRAFFLNIQSRCARLEGPVLITSTPYALNWLWDLVKASERHDREDILYRRWRSCDNPSYPQGEYDRLKMILPERVFKMRLEGLHDKAEGLVHADWNDDNWVDQVKLPQGTRYFIGVDWGFNHPFAVVVRGIAPDGNMYCVSIFKKSGLSGTQQLDLIESKARMFHVELAFCGHDRPEMIMDLGKRGIPAAKYFEFQPNYREIIPGDQKLSEIIKSKRYRVFKGIDQWQDLEDEYQTYSWDTDENDENRKREKAIDENNDLMAAERYVTVGMIHLLTEKFEKPKIPLGVEYFQDLVDFKKPQNKKDHWSSY